MSNYFNYEKEQKGFQQINKDRKLLKSLIGKQIVYLKKRDYDEYRGNMFPRYGILTNIYRNTLIIGEYSDEVDISEILEIAIKKN